MALTLLGLPPSTLITRSLSLSISGSIFKDSTMFQYNLRDVKVPNKHCNRGDMVALQVAAYRYHDLPRLAAYRYHMSQPNYHFQAHLALLHFEQVDMEDDDEIP
jgi:hypothetical protein